MADKDVGKTAVRVRPTTPDVGARAGHQRELLDGNRGHFHLSQSRLGPVECALAENSGHYAKCRTSSAGRCGLLDMSEALRQTNGMGETDAPADVNAEGRKRAGRLEKSLVREAHLRSILETIPDAMVVIDERGRILSFSAAAERMFGYSERELLGENVSTLMPSPDREQHDSYLERYFETGVRKMIGIGRVTTARHRDGSTFPIDLHVAETRIGDERVFTGFISDLTERQQTELRLHDLQSELAHVARVSEMGTFATSIAHELNQPLTAIANYVETAEELLQHPDQETLDIVREALRDCAAQSVRAGQIVRRLRDFISRGETERRVESLARVVNEASALALIGAGERGVEVQVKLDPRADKVLIDRIQVQQVIVNLVRNAIEAMVESQVRRLRITSRKAAEGFVEVSIEDSGPGLPAELADQLFQPFVSTKVEGMGLGLSICHTIINAHGGRIWSDKSRLGGTAFHFTLMDGLEERDG
jgi:two-component system sensor kinase FixL